MQKKKLGKKLYIMQKNFYKNYTSNSKDNPIKNGLTIWINTFQR